jgi:hypothetical protein
MQMIRAHVFPFGLVQVPLAVNAVTVTPVPIATPDSTYGLAAVPAPVKVRSTLAVSCTCNTVGVAETVIGLPWEPVPVMVTPDPAVMVQEQTALLQPHLAIPVHPLLIGLGSGLVSD